MDCALNVNFLSYSVLSIKYVIMNSLFKSKTLWSNNSIFTTETEGTLTKACRKSDVFFISPSRVPNAFETTITLCKSKSESFTKCTYHTFSINSSLHSWMAARNTFSTLGITISFFMFMLLQNSLFQVRCSLFETKS